MERRFYPPPEQTIPTKNPILEAFANFLESASGNQVSVNKTKYEQYRQANPELNLPTAHTILSQLGTSWEDAVKKANKYTRQIRKQEEIAKRQKTFNDKKTIIEWLREYYANNHSKMPTKEKLKLSYEKGEGPSYEQIRKYLGDTPLDKIPRRFQFGNTHIADRFKS